MLITAPLIVKTGLFVDNIQRPLLDFYENLGQIFPYNPQRHQLHAGKIVMIVTSEAQPTIVPRTDQR